MRVHHLNCVTMCPPIAGAVGPRGHMVAHCLLVESEAGLVLVDTGIGRDDLADPGRRLGRGFLFFARPKLDPAETAHARITALGFSPDDVRHVVVTHLDVDHAGGLPDFPRARVHTYAAEHAAAMARASFLERERYRSVQWKHQPEWVLHQVEGERWLGFDCVKQAGGLPPEILLVPLHGHTRGHCAVAVRAGDGWLLHCGDAYFHHRELDEKPSCPAGLAAFQRLVAVDDKARRHNQRRLRELHASHPEVRIFCAHDPDDLDALRSAASAAA
jgi:glyoxylase-like metal-dependent hydrolase (beta-lactamase superfamily II)